MNWKLAGRIFIFLWFFIGGIAHFVIPAQFLHIMPPAIPYPLAIVYISGGFELLGAFGLWVISLRNWAGYGLILLTICVTPANIYMWMHPELFPTIPEWALLLRLPVQAMLIWVIWHSTRRINNLPPSKFSA
ncbi:MAG TPA: hypothetical protein VK974_05395 [Methylophilaceae bacterium]|nr:hypothetical protein [Methylophilaceae bacterium]